VGEGGRVAAVEAREGAGVEAGADRAAAASAWVSGIEEKDADAGRVVVVAAVVIGAAAERVDTGGGTDEPGSGTVLGLTAGVLVPGRGLATQAIPGPVPMSCLVLPSMRTAAPVPTRAMVRMR
jgi:hypothetical protein